MNFLVLAGRIAGQPLLMMRDMGYDPMGLVSDAQTKLEEQLGWQEAIDVMHDVVVRAWEKAGLVGGDTVRVDDYATDTIHELEHLILDPDFDLSKGRSKSHHGVESVLEEALSWKLRKGGAGDEVPYIVADGAPPFLFPDAKTVGESIDSIRSAPISSGVRRKIRDSAVHKIQSLYRGKESELLDAKAPQQVADALKFRYLPGNKSAICLLFVMAVDAKFDEWKEIITAEREEAWRRFNLHLKNEVKKVLRARLWV